MTSADPFPAGFFDRADPSPDPVFYGPPRLVTHIDDHAIDALGTFYAQLGTSGHVLDLMSSWVSHLQAEPDHLSIVGMNRTELEANAMADDMLVHDLNDDPRLPFVDARFDTALCAVSVDYLVRPVEVFTEVARVLRPGGRFACSFSNRCFPTKAIRGWLETDDKGHCAIVSHYFASARGFDPPVVEVLVAPGSGHDPLFVVWASRSA